MRGLIVGDGRKPGVRALARGKASAASLPASFRSREATGRRQQRWHATSLVGVMAEEEEAEESCASSCWEDDLSADELGRLGSMPKCCLQRVVSPSEFYVSMSDPRTLEQLDKLYKAMDEFYNAHRMSPPRSVGALPVGSLCAARRSNSKHWFRGRIVGPSSSGSRHVKVKRARPADRLWPALELTNPPTSSAGRVRRCGRCAEHLDPVGAPPACSSPRLLVVRVRRALQPAWGAPRRRQPQ